MHQAQWSPERPLPPPVSLASQSHHEKPPDVTCTSRGNPEDMEGGEEEEEIRRPEQTKEEEGGVKHRGGWTMRGPLAALPGIACPLLSGTVSNKRSFRGQSSPDLLIFLYLEFSISPF